MQGADTVIYERLDPTHEANRALKAPTRAHMEEFGAAGLRTLCLSYAELDIGEYDRWGACPMLSPISLYRHGPSLACVTSVIIRASVHSLPP